MPAVGRAKEASFKPMKYWYYFWVVCFAVGGTTFPIIALIVLVRGVTDLRQMFTRLACQIRPGDSPHG
jgi:hypothetical protein